MSSSESDDDNDNRPIKKLKHDYGRNLEKINLISLDMLVNRVDIFSEKVLAKHIQSARLVKKNSKVKHKVETRKSLKFDQLEENAEFADPYNEEYELDEKFKIPLVDPKKTTIHEYVNKMREMIIGELRKEKTEMEKIFKRKQHGEENINENDLFFGKECFILEAIDFKKRKSSNGSPLQIYLFIVDFHLDLKLKYYFK